jgi:hypothetical protein
MYLEDGPGRGKLELELTVRFAVVFCWIFVESSRGIKVEGLAGWND